MGREIQIISLVFMLISGGTALFLAVMGIFPFALVMVFFFFLFFLMFVAAGEKNPPEWRKGKDRVDKKRKPLIRGRNDRYMRYCSSCGFTGSQKEQGAVPVCPVCGHALLATDTLLSEFSAMTEEERENVKKTWAYLG